MLFAAGSTYDTHAGNYGSSLWEIFSSHPELVVPLAAHVGRLQIDEGPLNRPLNRGKDLPNSGEGKTTVMIKRIPRTYTVAMLRDELEAACPMMKNGGYDLLYLPVDTAKISNRGYAFVNFTSHECLCAFVASMRNRPWQRFSPGSKRCAEIYFAHIQGREETIRNVDPTGSKNTTSPAYQSIGDENVWVMGFNIEPELTMVGAHPQLGLGWVPPPRVR
ncbi:hypothetical protein FOZ61_008803 [Perkinsus olseni]|uniref:Mei2-like C-terminal RNA recognition motif domain-containing protein n=2 Tax=Perkinsus olseni TaxID=32597 RepID=A0A7J6MXA9_PEROL|nr:hypothetical protein FOZ61_008803 [Perkinsus olseni]KAF4676252.1 hypothetical protein FOL46_006261 [Perkinsus olseni]